jgi:hypothetical protein
MVTDPLSVFFEQNGDRIDELVRRLGSYQPQSVDRERLRVWLRQVDSQDYELLLRILEAMDFYDLPRLHNLLRTLHRTIRAQTISDGFTRLENLVFVPMGETAESGQEIIRRYRDVNRIESSNARLAQVIELPKILYEANKAGEKLAVVFLDDFIGTGLQVTSYWRQVLSQYIHPTQPMYVGTVAACDVGKEKVEAETPLRVIVVHRVQDRHLFEPTDRFTVAEKYRIRSYCDQVGNPPLGIGEIGVLLSFAHGCPNNTLSIIRGSKRQKHWKGILPRFGDLP